jgi:hypothetical protein
MSSRASEGGGQPLEECEMGQSSMALDGNAFLTLSLDVSATECP